MFILDTNVVSELRKGRAKGNPCVIRWAESVAPGQLFVSVVTLMEIERGIEQLERKDRLQADVIARWFEQAVLPEFVHRTLVIDTKIALLCARLHVPHRRGERDALIAATGLAHAMTVVTRNVADFDQTGVQLLNPWL